METVETSPPAAPKSNPSAKRGWSTSDKLKAGSIAATLVVSILSLALSTRTQGTVAQTEMNRVETDSLPSNSNAGDVQNPWRAWEEPITPTTLYVGVRRWIVFRKPFSAIPRVSVSLGVINIYPMDDRLVQLGYVRPSEPAAVEDVPLSYNSSEARIGSRLRDFHVLSFSDETDEKGFWLKVGIGLPTHPGEFLVSRLQKREPPVGIIDGMRRYGQLPREGDSLTADERWLTNFYTLVGSFNVSWTAQQ